ncbi:MAG TPA: AMIN domain-containing protein [Candidatus Dormibacteraeota bacterium]|jgi:Tfp pilus assembly protein PilP|nr:AMIN domain-containing protein [Candidatus Dormibacteraeota bacterium]
MKLTTGILAVVMMAGAAWGQNPGATDNTGSGKSPQQTKANDTNATLAAAVPAAKPAPGAPASAVKPAVIPGAKPAAAPAQAAAKPASSAASKNNTLDKVSVVRSADDVQIEISSREAVTPKVTKLTSPVRVLVELPETVMATTTQSKIPVGSAGVKGVRIGMDGKTPPTTSVVVDLEQACEYDLTPGPGNKLVLTLHTKGAAPVVAKSTPAAAPAKASAPAPKQTASAKPVAAPQAAAPVKTSTPAAKTIAMTPAVVPAAKGTPAPGPANTTAAAKPAAAGKVEAPKTAAKTAAPATTKIAAKDTEKPAASGKPEAAKTAEAPKAPKPEEKKWAMNGKRDPFFSPVVQQTAGSGCSTGKKCLDIGQINLRGVVKSESGFIAVVTNSLNKAYFLHENDPVFNGYVVRITGDSVVFQETVQDKLGKPLTREVVKRIFTPAV